MPASPRRRAGGSRGAGFGGRDRCEDQLERSAEGGLDEDDALVAMSLLGDEGVDLIDVSGGTYFPGAPASADRRSSGPYFLEFRPPGTDCHGHTVDGHGWIQDSR